MKTQTKFKFSWFGLFVLAFVAWCCFTCSYAAVETTTVQGKVVMPNGLVVTKGNLQITISQPGTTPDTTTAIQEVVGGFVNVTISATGDVSFTLVPNDALTPLGTFYEVKYSIQNPIRASWNERWTVTTSPDPVDIGAITRIDVPPGITVGKFVAFVAVEPTGSCITGTDVPTFAEDTNKLCECVAGTWSCIVL